MQSLSGLSRDRSSTFKHTGTGIRQLAPSKCRHTSSPKNRGAIAALPMKDVIEMLISRKDLTAQQAEESLTTMLGDFVPEQAAAFLVLLRAKVRPNSQNAAHVWLVCFLQYNELARRISVANLQLKCLFQGEKPAEIAGLARAMLRSAVAVPTASNVVDIVGTGGDGIGSVNISTGASIVAAAAGAQVSESCVLALAADCLCQHH